MQQLTSTIPNFWIDHNEAVCNSTETESIKNSQQAYNKQWWIKITNKSRFRINKQRLATNTEMQIKSEKF